MAGSLIFDQQSDTNLSSPERPCAKCLEVESQQRSPIPRSLECPHGPGWQACSEPLENLAMDRLPKPTPFSKRPKRIILVRHGQSQGNVDASLFTREADWRVPLTDLGMQQAEEAGQHIRTLIEQSHVQDEGKDGADWGVFFYVSPYTRTLQTLRAIGRAFDPHRILGVREEPRLREQDFGNFQVQERMEMTKDARLRFGKFFFRFPEGESSADAYDRVTGFLDSFWRDIEWGRMHPSFREEAQRSNGGVTRVQSEPFDARPSFHSVVDDAARLRASWSVEPSGLSSMHARHSCEDTAEMCSASEGSGRAEGCGRTECNGAAQECGVVGETHRCNCRGGEGGVEHEAMRHAEWGRRQSADTGPGRPCPNGRETVQRGGRRCSVNVVVVTHGLLSRVFLMRWFRWTVAQFEGLWNPRNCEIRCMQLTSSGRYSLALQHSDEEMESWGLSPCMISDQHGRASPAGEAEEEENTPPAWACFFDHLPKGKCIKGPIENHRDHLEAPPSCLDTPI